MPMMLLAPSMPSMPMIPLMPMARLARARVRAAVTALLLLTSCAGSRVPTQSGVAVPFGRDFFEFPEKYRGRRVRLVNLTVGRADITRPIVLVSEDTAARTELVVSDGRMLASKQRVKSGDRVAVQFECTEGRSERGNLLVAIDPWPAR